MFLVRATSFDRTIKVFVRARALSELIETTRVKLNLPEASYQVYQEEDGTLIDDDAIFEALCEEAKSKQEKLSIMLLPLNQSWCARECIGSFSSSRSERSTSESSGSSIHSGHSDASGKSSESTSLGSDSNLLDSPSSNAAHGFPISTVAQFLDPVIEILDSSTNPPRHFPHLKKHAIKETFHAVGNHMLLTLRDYSKATARRLARSVMEYGNSKYARIFSIMIGDIETDSGHSSFTQQIYAYVQAHKGDENKKKNNKRSLEDDDDPDDLMPPPSSKQDCYGCVAFEIALPENESPASQERKRLEAASADPLSDEAASLMSITYASQRFEINKGKPMLTNLPKILDRWPLLKRKVFLISHADTLLGKDVGAVWVKSVTEKWKCLYDCLKSYWLVPLRKNAEAMLEIIENAENLDVASRSVEAKCCSIFLLIVGFMGEESSALVSTVHALSSEEDVLEAASRADGFPLIVVQGDSFIDPNAEMYVILVGKIAVRVAGASEAVLVLLLAYYIFNISYHPKLQSSLEFFQRFFLQVNPPKEQGNKRSKQKRSVDHVDAKVKCLAKKLTDFSGLWNFPSN